MGFKARFMGCEIIGVYMKDKYGNEFKIGDNVWLFANELDMWKVISSEQDGIVSIKNTTTNEEIQVNHSDVIRHSSGN